MYVYGSKGMNRHWLDSELRNHLEEKEAAP